HKTQKPCFCLLLLIFTVLKGFFGSSIPKKTFSYLVLCGLHFFYSPFSLGHKILALPGKQGSQGDTAYLTDAPCKRDLQC
ncbi:MAG: hypothetical protein IJ262_02950, partial [Clostridia bacterium]|nr:hypothetical protein [Clostridia bacterium]